MAESEVRRWEGVRREGLDGDEVVDEGGGG